MTKLDLVIKKNSHYMFTFSKDYFSLDICFDYNQSISKFESLYEAMIKNGEYYLSDISTQNGLMTIIAGIDKNMITFEIENKYCIEAIKKFIEHRNTVREY